MQLTQSLRKIRPNNAITRLLIAVNVVVFIAMLINGAGIFHSPNNIQLNWGANFGPATQDGEWWRLASAMFLHFGIIHLAINSFALWEVGQLTERMYGKWPFITIYLLSGLFGNLLSLTIQGNVAVSGGASGAIFGLYAALLIFLWREKSFLNAHEFRWLFGGAFGLAAASIALGFLIPGIDNAAHIGGFVAGGLVSFIFYRPMWSNPFANHTIFLVSVILVITCAILGKNIPAPKYRWSDELLLRNEISQFLYNDQAINRSWLDIVNKNKQGITSSNELADQIDLTIVNQYEGSFEKLSKLPANPNLPSATQLNNILQYAEQRKRESKAVADSLRKN